MVHSILTVSQFSNIDLHTQTLCSTIHTHIYTYRRIVHSTYTYKHDATHILGTVTCSTHKHVHTHTHIEHVQPYIHYYVHMLAYTHDTFHTNHVLHKHFDISYTAYMMTWIAFHKHVHITYIIQTCAHTYTHIHIQTCAHTYTHTHTNMRTYIHTYTHTNMCTHIHTYTHTNMCTHIHTYTHTNMCTHIHTYTHTNMCTHIHIYTYKHVHTHTHIYTYKHEHTHTHIQTCAHTYTHIHTQTCAGTVLIIYAILFLCDSNYSYMLIIPTIQHYANTATAIYSRSYLQRPPHVIDRTTSVIKKPH